ncbi:MAG: methylated-DNA--[protein]-cysteine S-methyltransferase [Xanthomonadales bacterium]|nr:methylated-DNA--[protein]-cysteine S-methyltransferase [Xanthomonadales bacterium]
MNTIQTPEAKEMLLAFMSGDASYDGIFYTGVKTTGIFCRPSCRARKPKQENIEFFGTAQQALFNGYRPCKRCRPMTAPGQPPEEIQGLLEALDQDPQKRWRDQDLRAAGLVPATVRRWFKQHHGMTFHAYARARRLGNALTAVRNGETVTDAAFDHGFESLSGFNSAVHRLTGTSARRGLETILVRRIVTPLGAMVAGATGQGVCLLEFSDRRAFERQVKTLMGRLNAVLLPGTNTYLDRLDDELQQYFDGALSEFSVPLQVPGTPFQQMVWKHLRQVPYATTTSYGELAARIGRPTASRAVARANGDNRLAILIPCHRVVGANGDLTGYGGGLWRKQRLLDIEMRR